MAFGMTFTNHMNQTIFLVLLLQIFISISFSIPDENWDQERLNQFQSFKKSILANLQAYEIVNQERNTNLALTHS